VFQTPDVPESVQPIVEILPIQMLSLALAAKDGIEAGRFERASKITNVAQIVFLSTRPRDDIPYCKNNSTLALYAIIAATCWGIWGILSKEPSRELSGWMTQMLFTFALIPSVVFASFSKNVLIGTNKPVGLFWGFVSGLIAAAGNIAIYLASENGANYRPKRNANQDAKNNLP